MEFLFLFMVFGVDAIIAKHLKVFFRDMYYELFNKIEGWNTFFNCFVIFVSGVMESDIITIVFINISEKYWQQNVTSAPVSIWRGFAFENVCFNHIEQIKRSLGRSGVITEASAWSKKEDDADGTQIDLLISCTGDVREEVALIESIDNYRSLW